MGEKAGRVAGENCLRVLAKDIATTRASTNPASKQTEVITIFGVKQY